MSEITATDKVAAAPLPGDEVAPAKKKLYTKVTLFGLVGCGVLFFVIVLYSNLATHKTAPFRMPVAPQIHNVLGATAESPAYALEERKVDKQNYTKAAQTGADAFPFPENDATGQGVNGSGRGQNQANPDDGDQPPPALDLQQTSTTPPPNVTSGNGTGAGNSDPGGAGTTTGVANQQSVQNYSEALGRIFQDQNQKAAGGLQFVAAKDLPDSVFGQNKSDATTAAGGSAGATTNETGNGDSGIKTPAPGTLLPARMINGLDSDAPGPALAVITDGPLQGARVIGAFTTTRGGLVLKFTTMVIPINGGQSTVTDSIQADAISETGDMVPANVNDHFLENAAVTFVTGFGQSVGNILSQSGSTTTATAAGSITSYPALTLGQTLGAAAGGAVGAVGQQFQQIFGNRPPTITITPGTTFTLAFTGNNQQSTGGVAGPAVTPSVGGLRANSPYGGLGGGLGGVGIYNPQLINGQQ